MSDDQPETETLHVPGRPSLEVLRMAGRETPVLFLHGYTSGAWQFASHVMPALTQEGFDCWALNLRGHGGSDGGKHVRRATFSDYAEDVERAVSFVAEKTGSRPILVGHSIGSVLARDYASRHEMPGLGLISFGDIQLGMKDFMVWMLRRFPVKTVLGMLTGRPSAMFGEFEPQYAVMYDGQPREDVRENVERLMAQPDSDKVFMELRKRRIDAPKGAPSIFIMAGDRDVIAPDRAVAALGRDLGVEPLIIAGEAHDLFAGPNWRRSYEPLRDWMRTVAVQEAT